MAKRAAKKDDKSEKRKQFDAYIAKYQGQFLKFGVDCLDINPDYIWDAMIRIDKSVREHQKTCVYAGHGVSKTYLIARIALGFLFTYVPSTVITTAPSNDQVEKVLWKEIHTAYANAKIPLGGKLTQTQLDVDPDRKWFAYGFSTKPDTVTGEATRMQGFHNDNVLIIFEEAAGIQPQIWKAAESLLTIPNCKIIAIGNPTSAQGCFVDCEKDPTWSCITVAVTDTPNFKENSNRIPGISGRAYEEMIRTKYGEDSNEYAIRIKGRKPEFSQGTFLGKWLAEVESSGRLGDVSYDPTAPVYTFWDPGDMYNPIWFVQFIGQQIRCIDFYYDGEGKGLPAYSKVLQSKPYTYGGHYAPPDLWGSNAKTFQGPQITVDVALQLGIRFIQTPRVAVSDRVEASRGIMPVVHFAEAAREGFNGLLDWRKRKNEALSTTDKPVYFEEAVRTWGCHVGDAFCGIATVYRYASVGGMRLGKTSFIAKEVIEQDDEYSLTRELAELA